MPPPYHISPLIRRYFWFCRQITKLIGPHYGRLTGEFVRKSKQNFVFFPPPFVVVTKCRQQGFFPPEALISKYCCCFFFLLPIAVFHSHFTKAQFLMAMWLIYSFPFFFSFLSTSWNSHLRHCAAMESSCALFPEMLLTSATRTGMNKGRHQFKKRKKKKKVWRND